MALSKSSGEMTFAQKSHLRLQQRCNKIVHEPRRTAAARRHLLRVRGRGNGAEVCEIGLKRPTQETYARDLQKRPTKETYKRDLHTSRRIHKRGLHNTCVVSVRAGMGWLR